MPHTKLKTNDYRLKTEINNFVNFLMPYCFFGLHLTCRFERGLKRKKCCTRAPFIIHSPNKTLL